MHRTMEAADGDLRPDESGEPVYLEAAPCICVFASGITVQPLTRFVYLWCGPYIIESCASAETQARSHLDRILII